ncbi:hypothetical protein FB451DRAFT_301542 [Mycena latifolia]|nr:hypothetical protein FB451DRAFT_301542 [Mycena latifolia]
MMTISPDSVEVLRQFYKDDEQWGRSSTAENDTSQLKHKTNWSQEIGPAHQRLDGQVRPGYQRPDAARRSCSLLLRLKINARVVRERRKSTSRTWWSWRRRLRTSVCTHISTYSSSCLSTPPAVPPVTPNAVAYVSWRIYALEFTFLSQHAASGPPLTPDAVAPRCRCKAN